MLINYYLIIGSYFEEVVQIIIFGTNPLTLNNMLKSTKNVTYYSQGIYASRL